MQHGLPVGVGEAPGDARPGEVHDGVGPGQIHLEKLVQRATDGTVKEVILATNFTNEGEVTAHVITELLEGQGVKVSRLARGIPIGSELEYVDAATVAQAVRERR